MLTYNALLFTERINRNLSRGKMAKSIGISHFTYSMIEKGYWKPSKKAVEKISKFLEIDYSEYLKYEASYPAELPEKKKSKFTQFLYRLVGHIAFRITFIVLSVASAGVMISGFIINNEINATKRNYYPEEYCQFVDNLRLNGLKSYSLIDTLNRPEYRSFTKNDAGETKYVSIIGSYDDPSINKLTMRVTYRDKNTRLSYYVYGFTGDDNLFNMSITYDRYDDVFTLSAYHNNGKFSMLTTIDATGKKTYPKEGDEKYAEYVAILNSKLDNFVPEIDALIAEKDPTFAPGTTEKTKELCRVLGEGNLALEGISLYSFLARYLGIVCLGLFAFVTAFGFLYGTKKGKVVNYRPAQLEVPTDTNFRRLKTDIRFSAFVPETVLEIIGILLVFFGSLRIIAYGLGFANGTLGQVITGQTTVNYSNMFMLGMFLLYFMDFDIFLDDKRVFRNIFLYLIVFLCLYALETLLYQSINDGSVVGGFAASLKLPNMFSSIACYYFIMLFLFYTPKRIKRKSTLIIYRCLSILPVSYIFVSWFLYNGYNVLYTADWPLELRNLFNSEKFPFSILAVTYLFSLFFLRLFFERRYGKEKATVFFNGNKFIWIKNILVVTIIIIIGVIEIILKDNITANKLGLGQYSIILILIPFLAFYHPHKGPRNLAVDITTLTLYLVAILFAYVATALLFLASLV